jgi:magnesium chelatase family protein
MLGIARTFALLGIHAEAVHVEVDVRGGLPGFTVVGLPDAAVRESRERIRAALVNCGFDFPLSRITASLAPADLPKAGPGFDLATAAALLVASNQIPSGVLERYALAGELALDGAIRPVPGVLAMAEGAHGLGLRGIAVPAESAEGAAVVANVEVIPVEHLSQLPELADGRIAPLPPTPLAAGQSEEGADLSELRGQPMLRFALEVAAAGGHSMLLVGPPGSGKTLAARRLPSLLPPLAPNEALEVARIADACANGDRRGLGAARPFRAPHHTISAAGLTGGGRPLRLGEVTRAHRGVLFLDELGEFRRDALEALRQPLEEGTLSIGRAGTPTVTLPCRFALVAASNPCPCGHGSGSGECNCHPAAVTRYEAKLSGALADRIEITLGIGRPTADEMAAEPGESSAAVLERVVRARQLQGERLGPGRCNAEMGPGELRERAGLDQAAQRALRDGHRRLGLSGRGWDRVIRVARTIADLQGSGPVTETHVESALSLRRKRDL